MKEDNRVMLMMIQKPEEQERVKQLEGRIAELENLVAQLLLDKFMLESTQGAVISIQSVHLPEE
jgi:hypothetical protein